MIFFKTRLNFQGKKKSFTLIELLAVVAIIAILTGLLTPALAHARGLAHRVECAGILRTFGQAGAMYAGNHSDYWVPPQNPCWHAGLEFRRLIGAPNTPLNLLESEDTAFPSKLVCPDSVARLYPGRSFAFYSYGATLDNLKSIGLYAFRLPRLLSPASSAAWMDAIGNYATILDKYREESPNTAPDGRLAYRHNDTLNAVFFDGHVENLCREEVKKRWNNNEWRFNKYFTWDEE